MPASPTPLDDLAPQIAEHLPGQWTLTRDDTPWERHYVLARHTDGLRVALSWLSTFPGGAVRFNGDGPVSRKFFRASLSGEANVDKGALGIAKDIEHLVIDAYLEGEAAAIEVRDLKLANAVAAEGITLEYTRLLSATEGDVEHGVPQVRVAVRHALDGGKVDFKLTNLTKAQADAVIAALAPFALPATVRSEVTA